MKAMPKTNRKHVIQSMGKGIDRVEFTLAHMDQNRAYRALRAKSEPADRDSLLKSMQDDFRNYRERWTTQPGRAHREGLFGKDLEKAHMTPLCVDIELSAMCDLACPFCYRQSIATPDKLMDDDLCYDIIDQAAAMGVPSIKFNWRGEPLLHPRLPEFIAYAKDKGIVDTIINTNAVTLTEKRSADLIEAGLDFLIYSFDGGTRHSYEAMRPGRFAPNSFDSVYANIRSFHEIRTRMGAFFPFTKIQMVLTEQTFAEQDEFFRLFVDCVDDVSVKAYTERGGSIKDLPQDTLEQMSEATKAKSLSSGLPYYRDMEGKIFIATERLPCEQPYQRIMISSDGAAAMCCYDWGVEHPIGYVSEAGYEGSVSAAENVIMRIKEKARGYDCFDQLRIPAPGNTAKKQVSSLKDIWNGESVNSVRQAHVQGRMKTIGICNKCPFKDTYRWIEAGNGAN